MKIKLAFLSFLTTSKLHEEYLNSCEGKEHVKRKLKCISTLIRPINPFLRLLVRVVLNLIKIHLIFKLLLGKKRLEEMVLECSSVATRTT